jgi:integrase
VTSTNERKVLTDKYLGSVKAPAGGASRKVIWDATVPHFGVRVTPKGTKSFFVQKRMQGASHPVFYVLGTYPALSLATARARAREALEQISERKNPLDQAKAAQQEARRLEQDTFEGVAEEFIAKYAKKNRSGDETERLIRLYLLPRFGHMPIRTVKRRDIADLLDDVEARKFKAKDGKLRGGPVAADHVLACVRKMFNWHATRDDEFVSPIVKGMARSKPSERRRTRVLSDDEIRLLWPLLDGVYGDFVKALFYTAQRRGEVAQMRRSQVGKDGVWTIPAAMYKTKQPQFVPLSKRALAIVEAQPVRIIKKPTGGTVESDIVFSLSGENELPEGNHYKDRLNKKLAANGAKPIPNWTLHDLRRTAKTLMSRAGVRPDISERVLGHVIGGVEGVYDRHTYLDEKRDALEKLATMLDGIVNPPKQNVVSMVGRKKGA